MSDSVTDLYWPYLQLLVHLQKLKSRIFTRASSLVFFIPILLPWHLVAEVIRVDSLPGTSWLQVQLESSVWASLLRAHRASGAP